MLKLLEEKDRRARRNKLFELFPSEGPLARGGYKKHLNFFAAGRKYRERLLLAANRVGKTVAGAYEATLHMTGEYPDWWEGHRFDRPTNGWAAGDTNETTRDILQAELLGPVDDMGTGMIPGDLIVGMTPRAGVPDAKQSISVRHVSGGTSSIGLKSYDQKRKSFQGTAKDFIWLDEEPPLDIYTECLLRTMTTDGLIMLTFTPLLGISEVVTSFLPGGRLPSA